MHSFSENPTASEGAGRVRNVISLAAIISENNFRSLVLQFVCRRYGFAPEFGATITARVGFGPRGRRK